MSDNNSHAISMMEEELHDSFHRPNMAEAEEDDIDQSEELSYFSEASRELDETEGFDETERSEIFRPPRYDAVRDSFPSHSSHTMNETSRHSIRSNFQEERSVMSLGLSKFSVDGIDGIDDDEPTTDTRTTAGGHQNDILAAKESRAVTRLRIGMVLVLVSTAIAVSATAFHLTSQNEQEKFTSFFNDQAKRIVDAFSITSSNRMATLESFALSITSHAKYSNSTWPFVTMPDFERRGTSVSRQAQVMSMMLVPKVRDEDTRLQWEDYAVGNQDWFTAGLAVQQDYGDRRSLQEEQQQAPSIQDIVNPYAIREQIYRADGINEAPETGPGPYFPIWQVAPVIPIPELVNLNLITHEGYQAALNALLEAEVAVVGRSFDFSDARDEATARRRDVFHLFLVQYQDSVARSEQNPEGPGAYNLAEYQEDPIADIYVPVYDEFHKHTKQLVGVLKCVVYWRSYFLDILPDNARGLVVVLENTCDQAYTYQINGPDVVYIGPGDKHDRRFDDTVWTTPPGSFLQTVNPEKRKVEGSCLYSIKIYPSEELESIFLTGEPALYTGVLVLMFLFTSMVFVLYDCFVERRQKVVMSTAVASNAIVSSLFPTVVRDRLMKKDAPKKERIFAQSRVLEAAKAFRAAGNVEESNGDRDRPIADVFENCTVLFADIQGFTRWSSQREPIQVFQLLEALYSSFDSIAKKRKVFKVETIGDCYLAVTGLPEAQDDHAVRMVQFAYQCLQRVTSLVQMELNDKLNTSELSMRFGMHSGRVTAGVLRGEKSRFQLFGDTVNTASRMESSGRGGKIHISQQTADLLQEAGKEQWLQIREEKIHAKGKGTMQTYWVVGVKRDRGRSSRSSCTDSKPRSNRTSLGEKTLEDAAARTNDSTESVEIGTQNQHR